MKHALENEDYSVKMEQLKSEKCNRNCKIQGFFAVFYTKCMFVMRHREGDKKNISYFSCCVQKPKARTVRICK